VLRAGARGAAHIRVQLTEADAAWADAVGAERHEEAERQGRRADWTEGDELRNHMLGARGELAYHRWRGIPWTAPVNTYKAADAEGVVQVRTTAYEYYKVKASDPDHHIVVFVDACHRPRTFEFVGWLYIREAKLIGREEDPGGRGRPCFRVLREQLDPMDTLPL
jgi:hypothetical protein